MAGDNQMDPDELERIVGPVARGEVDYAKANRLFTGQAWERDPATPLPRQRGALAADEDRLRLLARRRLAGGLHGDLAARCSQLLDLDRIYPRYGFPNDMLVHLNVWNARVRDVPSRPIYGVGERSGIKLRKVVPRISWLLAEGLLLAACARST